MFVDVCWHLLAFVDVSWSLLVFNVGVCWVLIFCVDLCWILNLKRIVWKQAMHGNNPTSSPCINSSTSGNQTWQWEMHHVSMIFSLKSNIHRGFSIAMFDYHRGLQFPLNTDKRPGRQTPWLILIWSRRTQILRCQGLHFHQAVLCVQPTWTKKMWVTTCYPRLSHHYWTFARS